MGRGRAKAKQTKVARDLKYNTPNTDFSRLQAELSSESVGAHTHGHADSRGPAGPGGSADRVNEAEADADDPYADRWASDGDEDQDVRSARR